VWVADYLKLETLKEPLSWVASLIISIALGFSFASFVDMSHVVLHLKQQYPGD